MSGMVIQTTALTEFEQKKLKQQILPAYAASNDLIMA
jgi:hypothetical protein